MIQAQAGVPPGFQISPHPSNPGQMHSQQPNAALNYNKVPNLPPPHPVPPPGHPMMRPSQQQMAQHLMNPQAHLRSQRMLQQQQQIQQHQQQVQRYEEILSITEPLDCLTNRNLALRRYSYNHGHMNALFANPWTVKDILKGVHHTHLKRKSSVSDRTVEYATRNARLKRKLATIQGVTTSSQEIPLENNTGTSLSTSHSTS